MKRIAVGIIYKNGHPPARNEAERLGKWLKQRGIDTFTEEIVAQVQNQECVEQPSKIPEDVDWIVVLGGDGTLLGAARKVGKYGVPILGVNLGGLGFMTEIKLGRLYDTMDMMLAERLEWESRLMLEARVVRAGQEICRFKTLNDVVINKSALARILDLDVYISDQFLTTFRADGLIISTPTGSTAYNLSAGGPILYPSVSNIILTPICPFTLTNRPIILPDKETIRIEMGSQVDEPVSLTFDGQVGFDFSRDDRVLIYKADDQIKLIKSPDQTYFDILREKLMWGGTTYNEGDK